MEFDESKQEDVNYLIKYCENGIDYYSQFSWGEKIVAHKKKHLRGLKKKSTLTKQ